METPHFSVGRMSCNTLTVKRKNGTIIKYVDTWSNKTVNGIEITKDGITKRYIYDDIGKEVLKEAQKQYGGYLDKILMIKREEGLMNISK